MLLENLIGFFVFLLGIFLVFAFISDSRELFALQGAAFHAERARIVGENDLAAAQKSLQHYFPDRSILGQRSGNWTIAVRSQTEKRFQSTLRRLTQNTFRPQMEVNSQ